MKRINWELDEAVALFDAYYRSRRYTEISDAELMKLNRMYVRRAKHKGLDIDEKFRNLNGLKMQLGCVHYTVTDGKEGLPRSSKIFMETHDLYKNNPGEFLRILGEFYRRYGD